MDYDDGDAAFQQFRLREQEELEKKRNEHHLQQQLQQQQHQQRQDQLRREVTERKEQQLFQQHYSLHPPAVHAPTLQEQQRQQRELQQQREIEQKLLQRACEQEERRLRELQANPLGSYFEQVRRQQVEEARRQKQLLQQQEDAMRRPITDCTCWRSVCLSKPLPARILLGMFFVAAFALSVFVMWAGDHYGPRNEDVDCDQPLARWLTGYGVTLFLLVVLAALLIAIAVYGPASGGSGYGSGYGHLASGVSAVKCCGTLWVLLCVWLGVWLVVGSAWVFRIAESDCYPMLYKLSFWLAVGSYAFAGLELALALASYCIRSARKS